MDIKNKALLSAIVVLSLQMFLGDISNAQGEFKNLDVLKSFNSTNLELRRDDNLKTGYLLNYTTLNHSTVNRLTQEFSSKQYGIAKFSKYYTLNYIQQKKESDLGFGGYVVYDNNISVNAKDRFVFSLGLGLAKQNSILNDIAPTLNYCVSSYAEYKVYKGLSIYFYGQYLSTPINKSSEYFDPYVYMNPLYLQTETGAGVKAELKNIKAELGMKSMINTQFNNEKAINSMNTKVTIGF